MDASKPTKILTVIHQLQKFRDLQIHMWDNLSSPPLPPTGLSDVARYSWALMSRRLFGYWSSFLFFLFLTTALQVKGNMRTTYR